MDNNNVNNSENTLNTDIICDILIVIFIILFAYYILGDKFEGFSSEHQEVTQPVENKQERHKQVKFADEDLISDEPEQDILTSSPENMPTLEFNQSGGLPYEAEPIPKKQKSKSKSRITPMSAGAFEPNLTASQKSVQLMNQVGKQNKKNYNCDLLGLDSDDVTKFKKDYYGMYAHQIECPKGCHMDKMGTKKCNLESDKGCNGIFTTEYNNPDVFALSYLSLSSNNKRPCVTCAETMSPEDKKRLQQLKLTDANISNFVNFSENVNLNSEGETPVDKMAEIRTCTTGTCNLQDYGKSIQSIYDNLLNTPSYVNKSKCDPYQLTGYTSHQMLGDGYAAFNKSN